MPPDTPDAHNTIRIDLGTKDSEASGKREAGLVVLRGNDLGRQYAISGEVTVLGRLADADICIPDLSLSRKHCLIERDPADPSRFTIRDLGSTNGTRVNNTVIREHELHDGDRITVGEIILKFTLLDAVDEQFHHEVTHRLRHDQLTGLLHIEAFYQDLDQHWHVLRRNTSGLSILMCDVDGLKRLNDTHGHLLGSELIQRVAEIVRARLKEYAGVAALYGGDEFIAYIKDDASTGLRLANTLCEDVRGLILHAEDGTKASTTISIGVAELPDPQATRRTLVHHADLALYAAKQSGRDCAIVYESGSHDDSRATGP